MAGDRFPGHFFLPQPDQGNGTMSDNQTDKNLRTVFSPLGEKFEVSPANAIDLTRHAGWTDHKPHPDAVREYCERTGTELPEDLSGEPAPAPAAPAGNSPAPAETSPAPAAETTPPPAAETAPATTESADAAGEQTVSGEAPEEVQEEDEGVALKTVPSDFADMDKDAVKAYIDATFPGTEIDGRKGRDALVAQALELAAARAA
jgi:hypothetical protein